MSVSWLSASALAEKIFTIRNRCPQYITLYINGQMQGLLATNSFIDWIFENSWSDLIWIWFKRTQMVETRSRDDKPKGWILWQSEFLHFFAFANNISDPSHGLSPITSALRMSWGIWGVHCYVCHSLSKSHILNTLFTRFFPGEINSWSREYPPQRMEFETPWCSRSKSTAGTTSGY